MDALLALSGYIVLAAGVAIIAYGLYAITGKLAWYGTWKWGLARQNMLSAKLGWNTGEPPEGEWVLVREYTEFDSISATKSTKKHDWHWAVMKRKGDVMYSANGGLTAPVKNCTGWLYITEEAADEEDI